MFIVQDWEVFTYGGFAVLYQGGNSEFCASKILLILIRFLGTLLNSWTSIVFRVRVIFIFIFRTSVFLLEDAHGIFQPSLYHKDKKIRVLLQQKSNYVIIRILRKLFHKINIEAMDTKGLDHHLLVLSTKKHRETVGIRSDETGLLCVHANDVHFINSVD